MALPTSGQLSLNDISVELGNTSGSLASLRTLSSAAGFSTPDNVSEFYGLSGMKASLVSYWAFEDDPQTSFADSHGSKNGSVQGTGVKDTTGKNGASFSWPDTAYGYVSSLITSSTSNWSVSCWFNHGLNLPAANNDCVWGWTSDYFALGCTTAGYMTYYDSGDTWNTTTLLAGSISTWYHVVVTMDSTNGMKLYLNNSSRTDSTISSVNTTFYLNETQGGGRTGAQYIDETAFWTRTLTANEVSWLYNSGTGRFYSSF